MNVVVLWIVWIVVVVVLLILLLIPHWGFRLSLPVAILISFFIAGLVVLFLTPFLDMTNVTPGQKTAFLILVFVAYLAPFVILAWIGLTHFMASKQAAQTLCEAQAMGIAVPANPIGTSHYVGSPAATAPLVNLAPPLVDTRVMCDTATGTCVPVQTAYRRSQTIFG